MNYQIRLLVTLAGRENYHTIEVIIDGGVTVAGIPDAYGIAYVVRDAQFVRVDGFGRAVPQRRRRVFVVGYLGNWRRATAVLLEPESLSGNSEPSRTAGQEITGYAQSSFGQYSEVCGTLRAQGSDLGGGSETLSTNRMVSFGEYSDDGSASTVKERDHKDATDLIAFSSKDYGGDAVRGISPPIRAGNSDKSHANDGAPPAIAFTFDTTQITSPEKSSTVGPDRPVHTLNSGAHVPAMAFKQQSYVAQPEIGIDEEQNATIGFFGTLKERSKGGGFEGSVLQGWAVRRLTPTECERLQGFPDGYTRIPWRKKAEGDCPDGPRYKALGNSMAVNVMRWIGQRIQMIEDLCAEEGL